MNTRHRFKRFGNLRWAREIAAPRTHLGTCASSPAYWLDEERRNRAHSRRLGMTSPSSQKRWMYARAAEHMNRYRLSYGPCLPGVH